MNHIDELAELHALGSLSPEDERDLAAHIASCAECRARVNDAERVVAVLALEQAKSTMPRRAVSARRPTHAWRYVVGFAAGLILPLLLLLPPVLRARNTTAESHLAFSALVNSHFSHVPFVRRTSDAPHAKLLYARTGEWLYVIALQPKTNLSVLIRSGNTVRAVGMIPGGVPDAELYVRNSGSVQQVLLVRGGVIVAAAAPR